MYQVYHAYRIGTLGTDSTRTFEFVFIFAEVEYPKSLWQSVRRLCRLFIVLDFDSAPFFCFSCAADALPHRHGPACPEFPGNAAQSPCCHECLCGVL